MSSAHDIETGEFALTRQPLFPPRSIRAVDWNIDRGLQLSGVIDFLATTKADLILLQEVDLNARRTRHLNVAKEIAQKLQMNYVFGREFEELSQGTQTSRAFHGQATLSRWRLSNARLIHFRDQSHFWRPRWYLPRTQPFQQRLGGRIALITHIDIGGRTLVTYNLHLESRGDDQVRCAQLREVLMDAQRYGRQIPLLIAGDLNLDAAQGGIAADLSQAMFRNPFSGKELQTRPARSLFDRARTIDWLFVRGPLQVTRPIVHPSIRASDHYPLSVIANLVYTSALHGHP
jgi:endonuclease/exonuclease/phosphatase family metal-dependent hydrolase